MAPNGARRIFVPTNLDLADILVGTYLPFENCVFLISGSQISGFSCSQISKIWPGPGPALPLGPGLALGTRMPPRCNHVSNAMATSQVASDQKSVTCQAPSKVCSDSAVLAKKLCYGGPPRKVDMFLYVF